MNFCFAKMDKDYCEFADAMMITLIVRFQVQKIVYVTSYTQIKCFVIRIRTGKTYRHNVGEQNSFYQLM